jgi:nucleotide-binding universal stress UspA family protein
MLQIKRILFPVDFSPRSRAAAPYAQEFAAHFAADLTLLYVVEPPHYNTALTESHRQHSEGFDQFFGQQFEKARVERFIEHGDAAVKIIEYAEKQAADLIMIPTQGMGIYRRLIIGSTSAKVLHDADAAVWTSVHGEQVTHAENIEYRHVCCAVNLNPHSVKVLQWAAGFAKSYGSNLTLLHAGKKRRATKAIEKLQSSAGSTAEVRIEEGDPAGTVAHFARELHADLLVIGRSAESGILGRLVGDAYSIIRQSPCPVVSV